MARKYPIVLVDGTPRQLPPDDTLVSYNIGALSASSGLIGGGDLSTGSKRVDVALASPASGVIFVGDAIGLDGQDLATAATAQASGNAALSAASIASASGVVAQAAANTALASGNAALLDIENYVSRTSLTFVAGSDIPKGGPVGLDDAGRAQLVRYARSNEAFEIVSKSSFSNITNSLYTYSRYFPSIGLYGFSYRPGSSYPNFVLAQLSGSTLQYGTPVVVNSFTTGMTSFEYDPTASGIFYTYSVTNQTRYAYGIVSGLSCTFVADGQISANTTNVNYRNYTIYDSTAKKTSVWWTWYDGASTFYLSSRPFTSVSGSTVTLGTAAAAAASTSNYYYTFGVVNNPIQGNLSVVYRNPQTGNGSTRTAVFNTNTYSYGTDTGLGYATAQLAVTYSPKDDKIAVTYTDGGAVNTYTLLISTSGNTSTVHTPVIAKNLSYGSTYSNVYDSGNNRILSFYDDYYVANSGAVIAGTISGTTVVYEPNKYFYNNYNPYQWGAEFSPSGYTVVAYDDYYNGASGYATVLQAANLIQPRLENRQNYLGTAQQTVASGSQVRVLLPVATDLNQTGLAPGRNYYVNPSTSGYTTSSGAPTYSVGGYSYAAWSGIDGWKAVGKAITTSGLLMLNSIQ